jgi:hypothetical protein
MRVIVDGIERSDQAVPLIDDGQEHFVELRVSECRTPDRPAPLPA